MGKKQIFLIFIILFLIITISGCKGEQDEIHIVPHHFNLKTYSPETGVNLAFVTTYEIESIENVSLIFGEESIGDFDGLDVKEYYELEPYKGYNIFIIKLILRNVQGDLYIDKIKYDFNQIPFSFETDIRIQSDFQKDVHFVAGSNGAVVSNPDFSSSGYQQVLKSNLDLKITNVYFEGTGRFDLNQYLGSILLNDDIIEDGFFIYANDPFYLEIRTKYSFPKEIMFIDQIIIEYIDLNGETDFGYVLVPLILYHQELCSEALIDNILKGEIK